MAIFSGIAAAVGGFFSSIASTAVGSFLLKTAASLGLSLLAQKLAGKRQDAPSFGVRGQMDRGADIPQSFIVGKYATAGTLAYVGTSAGHSPNAELLQVVTLSDLPVTGLSAVWVNGVKRNLRPVGANGYRAVEGYQTTPGQSSDAPGNYLMIKFYDGTQTVADPALVSKFSGTGRPWEATAIGTGTAYALVYAYTSQDYFTNGFPRVLFEIEGVSLYNPALDTSVGGSGSHRWDTPSTWEPSENPAVIIYNVLRGISYDGGWFYGLQGVTEAQLPVAHWIDQIGRCAASVDGTDGPEPQYRASGEIPVTASPADVIPSLLTACNGRLSDAGGVYKLFVGGTYAPVMSFSDDDIISTAEQSFTPILGLADTVNGVAGRYPSPDGAWQVEAAPPLYNPDYEEDDGGRRLLVDVQFDFVPYPEQVQRLMKAALAEARRARHHTITLPPKYWALEPGDVVEWTSSRNGYVTKQFRVDGVIDLQGSDVVLDLTEIDPSDYDFDTDVDFTPPNNPAVLPVVVPAQGVPGFAVSATSIKDSSGTGRRPAILAEWSTDLDDVEAIKFQIRVAATSDEVGTARSDVPSDGQAILSAGLLSLTEYEVRAMLVTEKPRPLEWSAWLSVTTGDLRLTEADLGDSFTTASAPTGLTLSTALVSDGLARVVVTFTAGAGAVSYEIGITETGGNEVQATIGGTRYEFDTLPGIEYTIRVRSVSGTGSKSAWTAPATITADADSTAPAIPSGLTATGGFNTIWVEWTANGESDFSHYEVVVKISATTPGAIPSAANLYRSPSQSFVMSGLGDNVTRYFWVRAVDTSGNKSDWSASATATTTVLDISSDPSAVPANLALSTSLANSSTAIVEATWDAASNAVGYEVGITRDGGNEILLSIGGTNYEFESLPGVDWDVRVRSFNGVRDKSAWASVASITAATDSIAPAVPSGLTATGGYEWIFLEWMPNTETDLSHYEIAERTVTTTPDGGYTPDFVTAGSSLARNGLAVSATRYYWIRAVDISGNASAWSSRVDATTATSVAASVTTASLMGLVDETSFASSVKPVEIVDTLPAAPHVEGRVVYLETDSKLYRNTGSGWTKAVDGADLVADSVTTGALAAGAVSTEQLAAGAATLGKLAVGDFTNFSAGSSGNWTNHNWALATGAELSDLSSHSPGMSLKLDSTHTTATSLNTPIDCTEGDQFFLTYWIRPNAGVVGLTSSGSRIRINFYDQDDLFISGANAPFDEAALNNWLNVTREITTPENAVSAKLFIQSDHTAGLVFIDDVVLRRIVDGVFIADGGITAGKLSSGEVITDSAQIRDAIITNAKIADLSAAKLTAGTALAGTITVSGTALSTVNSRASDPTARINANANGGSIDVGGTNLTTTTGRAADPAARINAYSTTIEPGKIVISGGTSLADWRGASDTTSINGGKIEAASVSGRAMAIGDFRNMLAGSTGNWDAHDWLLGTGASISAGQSVSPGYSLRLETTHSVTYFGRTFEVIEGQKYRLSCWVRPTAEAAGMTGTGSRIQVRTIDEAGIKADLDSISWAGDTLAAWSQKILPLEIPAGAVAIEVRIQSDQSAGQVYLDDIELLHKTGGELIVDGSIAANHVGANEIVALTVNIKDGIITNAKIADLSAAKLTAGTALAGSITVSGTALSTVESRADDPAARVNGKATQIEPGKIVISGGTSLADWRGTSDTTTINGGKIEAASVAADAMVAGTITAASGVIGAAAIETLTIAGNAVTVPFGGVVVDTTSATLTTTTTIAGLQPAETIPIMVQSSIIVGRDYQWLSLWDIAYSTDEGVNWTSLGLNNGNLPIGVIIEAGNGPLWVRSAFSGGFGPPAGQFRRIWINCLGIKR